MIKISTTILVVAEASATISISRLRDINDVLPAHLVEQQFPAFIRDDYPKMVEFTRSYYDYMAQTENGRIKTLRNIDETSGDYLNYLQNEFLYNAAKPNFQQDFASEDFIRFSRQFYATKGTEESIKFLFRAQTAQEVDIEYPSELIFKASTARWFQEQSIKIVMNVDSIPATYFIGNYLTIKNSKGEEQTIEVSNVVDVTAKTLQTEVSTIFEVFFTTELIIDVAPGDTLFGTNFYSTIIPSLVDVQIVNAGTNFNVGQVIKLDSVDGSGAIAVITNTLPGGVIRNLKIIKFGLNYTTNFYLNIVPDNIFVDLSETFTADSTATFSKGIIDKTEGFFESQSILRSDYVLNNSPGSSPNYTYPGYIGSYVSQSTNRQVFYLEQNYSGLLFCKIGAVCNYSGKYLDQTGIPSNEGVLQDNNYYQDFSYVIRSAIDIENYRDTIKALAHPAGFKMFGSVSIDNEFESETTLSTATVGSDVRVTDFDFLTSETLDRRISFTRTGTATRYNSSGLVETVAANTPRFDYDPVTFAAKGLLIEEARTNLFTYSGDIGNAAWSKLNVTTAFNVITSPNGAVTASSIIPNAGTSGKYVGLAPSGVTLPCVSSVYAKAGGTTFIQLINSGDAQAFANFDLATGVVGTKGTKTISSITAVGNGWYRCVAAFDATVTLGANFRVYAVDTASAVYGSNATTTGNVYLWGAQLEAGAFATSYVPSTNTFTSRASTATYYGSDGLLKTAASNVARYNYNPANLTIAPTLLLEAAATNLLTYSSDFTNTIWTGTNVTLTANATTSPDGTTTAASIVPTTTNGTHNFINSTLATINIGDTFSASIYVKPNGYNYIGLALGGTCVAGEVIAAFNLTTGQLTASDNATVATLKGYTATNVGNGWWRFSVTSTAVAADYAVAVRLYVSNNGTVNVNSGGVPSYAGDDTSGVYIWGGQFEIGSGPTSYIPTIATQLTRAADVSTSAAAARGADTAVVTGSNFSSWFNPVEGTIYAEGFIPTNVDNSSANYYLDLSDGTTTNRMCLVETNGTRTQIVVSNVVGMDSTVGAEPTTFVKMALGYKLNNSILAVNNVLGTADTSVSIPTVNRLTIGNRGDNAISTLTNGCLKKITYYPIRLTNAQIQSLTL